MRNIQKKQDLLLLKKFFFLQGHINIVIQRKSDSLMMSVNTNTMHLVMQTHSNYPFKLLVETYRLQGPCNYLFIFLQCSTFLSHWILMYYWILWNIQLKYNNKIKWALLYSNWDNFLNIQSKIDNFCLCQLTTLLQG